MSRLQRIEKDILAIHKQESDGNDRARNIFYQGKLRSDREKLEKERQFLLDRRESWLPKTIWMVIVPIVVSVIATVITQYVLNHLGIGK